MTGAQRILILTGVFLIAATMAFGVIYAIFDEHQTLVGMGVLMATGFIEAAQGNMDAAFTALDNYGALTREYRSEVHAHGHWGMLSLILIVLGLVYNRLALSERNGLLLAWLLSLSAFLFPLGVLFQIWAVTASIGKLLSVPASLGMVIGLLVAAWGLLNEKAVEDASTGGA
jgi:hypothetical protein